MSSLRETGVWGSQKPFPDSVALLGLLQAPWLWRGRQAASCTHAMLSESSARALPALGSPTLCWSLCPSSCSNGPQRGGERGAA